MPRWRPSEVLVRGTVRRNVTRRAGSQKRSHRSCGPPRAVTSTRDDRLCGPDPLPRAVRKPLPPRRAGEVPRLAARRRVDARESGAADGGIPPRLLGALAHAVRERGALRALSARRVVRLDLLRDVRAGCVALDARQREPNPEDALSPPARSTLDRRDPLALVRRDDRRAAGAQLRAAPARPLDGVACDSDRRRRRRDRE